MRDMKKTVGRICSVAGLAMGAAILIYLVHQVRTTMDIRVVLGAIRPGWLCAAALCVPVAQSLDALILLRMGRALDCPVGLRGCLDAVFIGEFYYRLGPVGAPVQLGLMYSAGMSATATASIYTWKMVANTMVYTGYAVAGLVFYLVVQGEPFRHALAGVCLLVGLYVLLCALALAFVWRPEPMIARIGRLLAALSRRIKPLGRAGRVEAVMARVREFSAQLQALRGSPRVLLGLLLLMFLELTALFSIPFLLYRGLGLTGYSYAALLLRQCLVMVLARIVLLPGNAGGAEGSFYLFMAPLFGAMLPVGLVLWRCAAFLEVLLLGGLWSIFRFAGQYLRGRAGGEERAT